MILINPNLKDIPSSEDRMSVGRAAVLRRLASSLSASLAARLRLPAP